jgi:hypothetical protein
MFSRKIHGNSEVPHLFTAITGNVNMSVGLNPSECNTSPSPLSDICVVLPLLITVKQNVTQVKFLSGLRNQGTDCLVEWLPSFFIHNVCIFLSVQNLIGKSLHIFFSSYFYLYFLLSSLLPLRLLFFLAPCLTLSVILCFSPFHSFSAYFPYFEKIE